MKRVEKLFLEQCAAGAFPGGQLVVQRGKQRQLDLVLGRGFGLGWRLPHPYGWWNSQRAFGHCGGFSVVAYADRATNLCTPNALCHHGGIALGAQAGPEALRQALAEGGLRHFRVAAKTPFHMVIEARAH